MYLGIDLGTSAVKAVIAADDGALLAQASHELSVSAPQAGWREQVPDDWWAATQSCLEGLREKAGDNWKRISAIGLSGQMHGAVLLDTDRRPLRPAILWNDGRSAAQCAQLMEKMPDIASICGTQAMPGFTAPKIMWVKEHEPEIYDRIAHILLPKDYVRLQLTSVLATDMADAAGTMWLDQEKRAWSDTLCDVSQTDPDWLPTCLEGTSTSGRLADEAARDLGLPEGIPVAAGGGDAATGAVGIGAVSPGDAFISLGTSGQLFTCNDRYTPAPEGALHSYAHCVPDRWFQMAAMLNGASPLAWFAGICGVSVGDLLDEAAGRSSDRVPLFLPYLAGERTPHNDPLIRGSFSGLSGDTRRADMTLAVVEAIAYSFCDARDALAKSGTTLSTPSAIGGGARSGLVLQTMSDALGFPIERRSGAETGPSLGAALLGGVASGGLNTADLARKPPVETVFQPDPDRRDYHQERLEKYRLLYRAIKSAGAGR